MPATTGPKITLIPPVTTPRESGQLRGGQTSVSPGSNGGRIPPLESTPGRNPPSTARVPSELLEILKEIHNRLVALEGPQPYDPPIPGKDGKDGKDGVDGDDADCTALAERVGALERMLTPDASGHMTGLPPIWATFRDVETGQQWTAKVYLGDGFRDTPPKKITPSLRGEGR